MQWLTSSEWRLVFHTTTWATECSWFLGVDLKQYNPMMRTSTCDSFSYEICSGNKAERFIGLNFLTMSNWDSSAYDKITYIIWMIYVIPSVDWVAALTWYLLAYANARSLLITPSCFCCNFACKSWTVPELAHHPSYTMQTNPGHFSTSDFSS